MELRVQANIRSEDIRALLLEKGFKQPSEGSETSLSTEQPENQAPGSLASSKNDEISNEKKSKRRRPAALHVRNATSTRQPKETEDAERSGPRDASHVAATSTRVTGRLRTPTKPRLSARTVLQICAES
jgi:hypothetical protein